MERRRATRKRRIAIHDLRGSLADDDQAHDDCLLGSLVRQELILAQAIHEAARICCRLPHVAQVIPKAAIDHTG